MVNVWRVSSSKFLFCFLFSVFEIEYYWLRLVRASAVATSPTFFLCVMFGSTSHVAQSPQIHMIHSVCGDFLRFHACREASTVQWLVKGRCAGRYFSASELLSSCNACEWLVIVTVMISWEMRVYEYVAMGGCRGELGDLDWREWYVMYCRLCDVLL